jgi:imidazolonepropionase-like amidohydrolase
LHRAGLSHAAIMRAATLDAAKFMRLEADHGTVERGKIADLVLLESNPLEDIAHAARPRAVVFDGRLLDAQALRRLEEKAATTATASGPSAASSR